MQEPGFSFVQSVTVAEFCAREGISKNLAYKLIRLGELPAYIAYRRETFASIWQRCRQN